jgi:hypothetical protein
MDAGNKAMTLATSDGLRSGVADSIEQHMVKVNEPGGPFGLGNETERGRVCQPTVKRRLAKDGWSGMWAGIAKKPGNAGGVKARTVFARGWTNIYYTQR